MPAALPATRGQGPPAPANVPHSIPPAVSLAFPAKAVMAVAADPEETGRAAWPLPAAALLAVVPPGLRVPGVRHDPDPACSQADVKSGETATARRRGHVERTPAAPKGRGESPAGARSQELDANRAGMVPRR